MRLTYWNDRKGHFDWRCENNEIADKLAAYEDAEEHGLLVRLPYAVGDTFWAIAYSEPRVIHVRLYQITNHYEHGYILWVENIDKEMDWWKLPLHKFEEWSHFASKEEAEAKLREVEHG